MVYCYIENKSNELNENQKINFGELKNKSQVINENEKLYYIKNYEKNLLDEIQKEKI